MIEQTVRSNPADKADEHQDPHGWRRERKALFRAVTGGAIVGIPLLFTMEMWQTGAVVNEWHLILLLVVALLVNFVFSLVSGFRKDYSVPAALNEAVSALALGVVFAAAILTLIGELDWTGAVIENVGKIIVASVAVSLGASFANSQVSERSRTGEENGIGNGNSSSHVMTQAHGDPDRQQLCADLSDAGATVAGATVFALNIAPTEEVIAIAARLTPWHQLALLAAMLVLCYVILFASGFEQHHVYVESVLQNHFAETAMATALSLLVAAILLALLGHRELLTQPSMVISGTLVLGLPAVVGGAAGRLIV